MKFALLVGIDQYETGSGIARLKYACRDAWAVGAALKRHCGFEEVRVLADSPQPGEEFEAAYRPEYVDLPTDSMVRRSLRDAAAKLSADDLFLGLFTGHGWEREVEGGRRTYLLARNADLRLRTGLIELGDLKDLLADVACRRRMLLWDCCRNAPEAARGDGDNRMSERLSKDIVAISNRPGDARRTTIVMTACRSGQRAYEWDAERHGAFSYFVRKGLEGAAWGSEGLDGLALCRYVETGLDDLARRMKWEQRPDFQQLESSQPVVLAGAGGAERDPRAPLARGEVCPWCGKRNHATETFRCRVCGRDYLCREHYVKERRCCEECAAQATRKCARRSASAVWAPWGQR